MKVQSSSSSTLLTFHLDKVTGLSQLNYIIIQFTKHPYKLGTPEVTSEKPSYYIAELRQVNQSLFSK